MHVLVDAADCMDISSVATCFTRQTPLYADEQQKYNVQCVLVDKT